MLTSRLVPGLPRLGWVATVERDGPDVKLLHGALVKTRDDGFVAGAWDGPFADFGLTEATTLMGSGGRVTKDTVTFSNASHPFDLLFSMQDDDAVYVSNSLSLLLARTDDGPDLRYRKYRGDRILQQWAGTTAPPTTLPTRRGRAVLAHMANNVTIGADLSLENTPKPPTRPPTDFADYRTMLVDTVRRLTDNATDYDRKVPLRTLTTVSSGYDSATVAVLAAECGIHDALTLVASRSDGDSGQAIGETLGLGVSVRTIDIHPAQQRGLDVEFAASSSGPMQFPLAVLDGEWRDSLVLVGSLGDDLWDRDHGYLGDHLAQRGALVVTPNCVHEFALRAGIVFAHVPLIGAVHCRDVRRITNSAEMAPWTLGTKYDRPIPRRIVEEAGIPRGTFATRKFATAAISMDATLSTESRADFDRFWKTALRHQPLGRRLRYRIEASAVAPLAWLTGSVLAKTHRMRRTRHRLRWWSYHASLPSAYHFHWAVSRLVDRYGAAMASEREASVGGA